MYVARTLEEVEALAVKELAVAKDDMYFDVISENEKQAAGKLSGRCFFICLSGDLSG